MRNVLVNAGLFILSLVVVCAVAEAGVRFYAEGHSVYDIEVYKYGKHLKRRSSIPGLSHEHIPGSEAHLMGVDVKINSLGFRDTELPANKPVNEYRVLVAGQSITFGWGVPQEASFCKLTQKKLNQATGSMAYNFVNTGIGNYNTVLESVYLKRNLDLVRPDMVVLHTFLRDAEEISAQSQNVLVERSYLMAYLYGKIQRARFVRNNSYESIGDYYSKLYQEGSEGWRAQRRALTDIKQQCDSRRIPLLVVMQPDLNEIGVNSAQEQCYVTIRKFLADNGFTFIDMAPVYRAKVPDIASIWVSRDDSHPNSAGHALIADELYAYFKNHPIPSVR